MSKISKIIMWENHEIADFYADAMAGDVIELRKNTATISTPAGLEHPTYWELREFKRDRDAKYVKCMTRVRGVFNRVRSGKVSGKQNIFNGVGQ